MDKQAPCFTDRTQVPRDRCHPTLFPKTTTRHSQIGQHGLQQQHAGVVEVCAPQLAVQRCKASSCVAITAVADLLPRCGPPAPSCRGALLLHLIANNAEYCLARSWPPSDPTPVPAADSASAAAGIDRQQPLLASARHAAGGLLAGLAAAAVSLSAGPAGAEVRMPPIDRNGAAPCHCRGCHQRVSGGNSHA